MRWASSTGLRSGTCSTPVPISMREVTAAATEAPMSGSGSMKPRPIASKNQALSKPARSMARALPTSASPVSGAPSARAVGTLTPSLTRSLLHPIAARVARAPVLVLDDAGRRGVSAEQPQLLVAHHPERVRCVRRQRDGVALAQQHRAVLLPVDPGLRGAVEDVQDLQVRVRVHRRHVARLRGLDAGAQRRAALLVTDDGLVVGERAEAHPLGLVEPDYSRVAHVGSPPRADSSPGGGSAHSAAGPAHRMSPYTTPTAATMPATHPSSATSSPIP